MNRESVELGFTLKRIDGYEFSMKTFDDRLRLQKMVYLLQAFGIYLGYDFSWYLRGPYCSLLAHNAFSLEGVYDEIPDNIRLKNKGDRDKFGKFLKFVKNKTIDDLEIAASLHYLRHVRGNSITREEMVETVAKKQDRFTERQVDDIWQGMQDIWREMEG